jgi:hypothetical protein
MARAWGGIVPDDTNGPHNAREEMAGAGGAPTGTPEQETPLAPPERVLSCAEDARTRVEELLALERDRNHPAQLHPITFIGAQKQYVRRSEHPPLAKSVGVVNPVEIPIYLGLDGGPAKPNSHAFVVPAKSAMIIPVEVDKFEIGVDPTELAENTATIFLLRFKAVQAFFFGAM